MRLALRARRIVTIILRVGATGARMTLRFGPDLERSPSAAAPAGRQINPSALTITEARACRQNRSETFYYQPNIVCSETSIVDEVEAAQVIRTPDLRITVALLYR